MQKLKINKKLLFATLSSIIFLNTSFAANPISTAVNDLTDFFGNAVSTLLFSVATVAFFVSVIRFLINRSSGKGGEAWEDAKERLLWSAGALFVMFSIWGIVNFLQAALLGDEFRKNSITAPTIENANRNRSGTERDISGNGDSPSIRPGTGMGTPTVSGPQ